MIWLGILGVIACFAVLIFAAYKKISMVIMAPVAAIIIAVTNGLDVAEVLSGVYSEGMVGFIKAWFWSLPWARCSDNYIMIVEPPGALGTPWYPGQAPSGL